MTSPGDRWRQALQRRAVPAPTGGSSPEPEPSLDPERFRWKPERDALEPVRPARLRALEALPEGGSVLDVGVGGGAASLCLAPRAATITGVDRLPGMLELFERSGRAAGVTVATVLGPWPEVASHVGPADVAISHHAIYGVVGIEGFLAALTARARRRAVLEVWTTPPDSAVDPLWKPLRGVERKPMMVAEEVESVLRSMGLAVEREDMPVSLPRSEVTSELVARVRRRLRVGEERDAEITEFLHTRPAEDLTVAALWWPGEA